MTLRIKRKIEIKKPTLKDWLELILPETKKTRRIDAQEILIKSRYSKN